MMGRRDAASQQSRGSWGLPAVAVAAALCLSGCASISQKFAETASQLPEVGLSPTAPERPVPEPPAAEAAQEDPADSELAEVIPLGLFDPLANPWRRP